MSKDDSPCQTPAKFVNFYKREKSRTSFLARFGHFFIHMRASPAGVRISLKLFPIFFENFSAVFIDIPDCPKRYLVSPLSPGGPMLSLPSMTQVIEWFGWGNGFGALAAISIILTALVLITPVIAGMALYGLERLQIEAIGAVNRDFAYFFVNFLTFPGTFVHEMSHLCFGVITGVEVTGICMFESGNGRLGHISYRPRGPWFMEAVQHTLTAVAPTVVGFALGYCLLKIIFSGSPDIWESILLWYLVISLIDHSTMSEVDLQLYFQGVWIFIVPVFLVFFISGILA